MRCHGTLSLLLYQSTLNSKIVSSTKNFQLDCGESSNVEYPLPSKEVHNKPTWLLLHEKVGVWAECVANDQMEVLV